MTQLPAIDDGLGIIVRSMVREGRLVAVLTRREAARRAPFSADLVVNGVTRSSAECPAGADEVTLSAPVPADDVVLSSLAVEVAVDGARSVVPASAEHALPRLVMRDMEDFRATVMRKQYRIGDPETLLEAARTAARRFPDDITIQAVSLSVIGYRYIETPALASRKEVLEFARRADRLRARLDDTDPDDARWSPSIDVMLYQLFAVRLDHPRAVHYLCRLYAGRNLVHVAPMVAFNLSIGVVMLGYLYFITGRAGEAALVWRAWEDIFVTAATLQPKRVGTIREFAFINKSAMYSLVGIAQVQRALSDKAPEDDARRELNDRSVAAHALRTGDAGAQRQMRRFLAGARHCADVLPDAKRLLQLPPARFARFKPRAPGAGETGAAAPAA